MVTTQEIIERSFFMSILNVAKAKFGVSLDPSLYISESNDVKWETDKKSIISDKGYFVNLFGAGNNQSKGVKDLPRISIVPQGFIPGEVGIQSFMVDDSDGGYKLSEFPNETIHQYIEVHLEANLQEHMRALHMIMFQSLPKRGYIAPYGSGKLFSGNIFVEIANFGDFPDTQNGVMHKIYTYEVKDTIIEPIIEDEILSPIKEITVDVVDSNDNLLDNINIKS